MSWNNDERYIGNITKDIDKPTEKNGTKFCHFTIAVNRNYSKDKRETESKLADFIHFTAFGKIAENLYQYNQKGDTVLVVSHSKDNNYTDKETGKTIYSSEHIVEEIRTIKYAKRANPESEDSAEILENNGSDSEKPEDATSPISEDDGFY